MKIRTLLWASILLLGTSAKGAILNIDPISLELFGASDILVDGIYYNVSFQDGTCAEVFTGCDERSDFAFNTGPLANLASQALIDQVYTANNLWDVDPTLTRGITDLYTCAPLSGCGIPGSFSFGEIFTVFDIVYSDGGDLLRVSTALNASSTDQDWTSEFINGDYGFGYFLEFDPYADLRSTWANWTPVSLVPIPAAIWLFGTALVGLVGFGKRRKAA